MEKQYLDALRSYYYEGKSLLTDEEFDNLKEELTWNGSKVVVMSSDEQRFLEATAAIRKGSSILSEDEYEELTDRLRVQGSTVVMQGPRCSLLTRKVYTDARLDAVTMTALNIPAAVLLLSAIYLIDRLAGEPLTMTLESTGVESAEAWLAVMPFVIFTTASLTNLLFRDMKILKGPCPQCGTENVSYFGYILTIPGPTTKSQVQCSNCGSVLEFNLRKREILYDEESTQKVLKKKEAQKRQAAGGS